MSAYRFCMTFAAMLALVIASPVVHADDECATASPVSYGANAFDTTGYTPSAEPNPTGCTNAYGQNLADGWYSFTADCDGTTTFETCDAASFDTDLAVYDGGCGALNLIACDGDGGAAAGCQGFDSALTISTTAGTTYQVRIGGWGGGEEGPGTLTITNTAPCPTPDECAGAATVVDGANAFDTTGYTASAEPNPTGCANAYGQNLADGWYAWTAGACDTTVTIETCDAASFDTDLAMYDGDCSALNLIACDGDGGDAAGCQGFDSKLTDVPVTAGTTYLLRVGGWGGGEEGPGTLTITPVACPTPDDCAGAAVVVDGANAFDTTGYTASAEPNPTGCANAYGQNLADGWYAWTAGANTCSVTVETCDAASFDTDLAMYDGDCSALNLIACDGDGGDAAGCQGFDSKLTDVPVTAGTTYLLRVGGWGGGEEGPGTLTITPTACPTPGDECVDAITVGDGANAIDTTGFTDSADAAPTGCTNAFGNNASDGWYSWTAGACDTTVTIDTCDPASFDTDLAMYDGGCGALNLLACDGDSGAAGCQGFSSQLTDVPVTAGTTYLIRVGGWGSSDQGPGTLNITPVACPPSNQDECADAGVVFDGANAFDTTGYTDSADAAPTGCTNAFGNNASDGWYSWTAGDCTTVTIDTCDPASFDTDLAMYDGGCGALNLLACDGDSGAAGCQGFSSQLTDVPVTAGTTYLIRVGGWGSSDQGPGTLNITPGGCPPPDSCATATPMGEGANAFDTTGFPGTGTAPTGCTASYGNNAADGWFTFTPSGDGVLDIDTCDPASFDTDLALYSGDCSALNLLACDGDSGAAGCQGFSSAISGIIVNGGETYLINIGGWGSSDQGPGTCNITLTLLAPEDCSTPGDEDGDGLADCADPDCAAEPQCQEAGNCADNVDNDQDGDIDCADADCAADLICQGCPIKLTQNLDTTTSDQNLVACAYSSGEIGGENSYGRTFDTSSYDCPAGIRVTEVSVGIGAVTNPDGLGVTVTIDVYQDGDGGAPDGGMTLIASVDIAVTEADANTVMSVAMDAPLTSGATLVVAARLDDMGGTGNLVRLGRNSAGETAPTYLNAPLCGLPWGPLSAIGFGDHHVLLQITTDDQGAGVTGDECSSAIPVTEGANAFDTTGMSDSPEPDPTGCTSSYGQNASDGWFSYTASYSGNVTMDTCDAASHDTDLAAYSGDCANLTLLACDGDGNTAAGCQGFDSIINLGLVQAGETIIVRIGGWGAADQGPGTLNITNVPPLPTLNEIRIDNPGSDTDEYFELAGYPQPLDGLTYIVIGDGAGGSGTIESVTDLAGQAMGAGGFWWAGEASATLGTPDLVTTLGFENSDNVTHMLVLGFTGANGDDLDTDDDGILDVEPWSAVVDSVALLENAIDPTTGNPSGGEMVYSATTVGPDGNFVPGHVERCPDGSGPWAIANFDHTVGSDTPGAANSCLAPPTNDECDTATDAFVGVNDLYNVSATDSADAWDTACADSTGGAMAADVWYRFVAPGNGTVGVSTCDTTSFDTDISWSTGACGALTQIACSGDAGDGSGNGGACQAWYSEMTGLSVTAGSEYMIRIGGWSAAEQGSGTFTITFAVEGDEPCDAVEAFDGTTIVDNTSATDGTVPTGGDADSNCPGTFLGQFDADMWFSYTATCDGVVTVDTCDANGIDTDLAVYEGDCATVDQPIACNGDDTSLSGCQTYTSLVEFQGVAGNVYLIRVGGWADDTAGITEMHIACAPDADPPTAAFTVSGGAALSINFRPVTLNDASADGGDATATVEINWGDGSPNETVAVGSSTPHLYAIELVPNPQGFEATPSITITNIVGSDTATGSTLRIIPIGDANNDLSSNAADAVYVLGWMYIGGAPLDCYQAGDLNGDEVTNLADVVYGLYYLFVPGSDIPVLPANPNCDL